jgi:hypothetical protein
MNCLACNTWFQEKKSPITGTYETLCPVCLRESNKEIQEAILSAEERLLRPSKKVTLVTVAQHYADNPSIREGYRDGLGLLSPEDREEHMFGLALERAAEAFDNGTGVEGCIEAAFGLTRFRGSQVDAKHGLTEV